MLDFSAGNMKILISSFYNVFNLAISASVPIRQAPIRNNCLPWSNKVVKYNRKNKFCKKCIKIGL